MKTLLNLKKSLIIIALLSVSSLSGACWYNGYAYPPGTVVAGLVCQADGTWKPG